MTQEEMKAKIGASELGLAQWVELTQLRAELETSKERQETASHNARKFSSDIVKLETEVERLKAEIERLRTADDEYIAVLIDVIKELGPALPYTRLGQADKKFQTARAVLEAKL
jgi:hypothetical protein